MIMLGSPSNTLTGTLGTIATEMFGPINDSAREFLLNLGHMTSLQSGNDREASFLLWQLSILIQRLSAVLLHDSCAQED